MIKKLRTYNEITEFASIARRYFVNNFYDGNLTVLGILLGFFTILLRGPLSSIESVYVVLPSMGTAISMLISGISGSYLSERAEQKKDRKDLDKAMGVFDEEDTTSLTTTMDEIEIEKAMVEPPKKRVKKIHIHKKEKKKEVKTVHEKAESFSGIVVSFVNGFSPFLGAIVAIIPFFFVKQATISTFITSFLIIFICIVLLGCFLGRISQESMIKNIAQMALAFFLTMIITLIFLG